MDTKTKDNNTTTPDSGCVGYSGTLIATLRNGATVTLTRTPHPDYPDYPLAGTYRGEACRWAYDGRWTLKNPHHMLDVVSFQNFGSVPDIPITSPSDVPPSEENLIREAVIPPSEENLIREAAGEAPSQHPKPDQTTPPANPCPCGSGKPRTALGCGMERDPASGFHVDWCELSRLAREWMAERGNVVSIMEFDDSFAPFGVSIRERLERTGAYVEKGDRFLKKDGSMEILMAENAGLKRRIAEMEDTFNAKIVAISGLARGAAPIGLDSRYWTPAYGDVVNLMRRKATLERVVAEQSAELEGLRKEMEEKHAIQLAAISTACVQNTRDSAKQRIGRDSPYWTQAYADVCGVVDREMELRAALEGCRNTIRDLERIIREQTETARLTQRLAEGTVVIIVSNGK